MINFNAEESAIIQRLSVVNGWDHDDAAPIKLRIKNHLLGRGTPCCCYCGCGMNGWHRMTIDIEHVLPKNKNPLLTFDLRNLGLACKRCNMTIKHEDESFFVGTDTDKPLFRSADYKLIHPAHDRYADHLRIFVLQVDDKFLVSYAVANGSAKGSFTHAYFRLQELEIATLDELQGLRSVEISSEIPAALASTIRDLANRISAARVV